MAASDDIAPLRWGRILGLLLALFLVAEAGSQAFFHAWSGRPFGSIFLYQWSPYGLVRNNPDLTGNFTISPDGFRDTRDYEPQKPANTFRVLLLGGSVLYSGSAPRNALDGYVPSDRTVAHYLETRLEADPAFKGINVEVINAGISFNRIVEVTGAYLGDYIRWSPDVVIVFGSANNFFEPMLAGHLETGNTPLQRSHPWRAEFDRLVNERSLPATLEVAFRQGADASAALALAHKTLSKLIVDTDPLARFALRPPVSGPAPAPFPLATAADEEAYFRLYTAHAGALIEAARREGQEPAFVWEYFLGDIGHLKTLSAEEKILYPAVRHGPEYLAYQLRSRDRWLAFLAETGAGAVDPFDEITKEPGTVFIDYLHYTAHGNDVVAGATYTQLHDRFLSALARNRAAGAAAAAPAPASAPAPQ